MTDPHAPAHPQPLGGSAGVPRPGGSGYILYAEDNLTDATFFIRALSRFSPSTVCHHLENGALAYRFLQDCVRNQKELPQLVVLDIKMPGLTGLDLLEHIRRTPETARLPVVILSASAEVRDLNRAYDCDINAYLVKPNRYRQLTDLVKALVTFWILNNQVPS
ncbi:response regulator [Neolewinella litorea]|uniref:Response regulator n=1 Tax=Neolewinella litorea TaxID=2562452 RepID=A0A4S4NAK3_9BACT|nr:response regulator [Neolewinella litorea]THH36352.1 response regulator [Neolewinella litorea]